MDQLNTAQTLRATGFNPKAYKDGQSGFVTIKDPEAGAPTAPVIELAGPEHPHRKRETFNKQRRLRQDLAKSGKVQFDDSEEEDAEKADCLATYTLGWRGMLNDAGQAEPFSREAALAVYRDPELRWLRDQVSVAFDERERFVKRSATS
jgi:hypothetical protein